MDFSQPSRHIQAGGKRVFSDEGEIISGLREELDGDADTGGRRSKKATEHHPNVARDTPGEDGMSCPEPSRTNASSSSCPPNEFKTEASRLGLDPGSVCPDYLAALPRDVAHEVLQEEKGKQDRRRSVEMTPSAILAAAGLAEDGGEGTNDDRAERTSSPTPSDEAAPPPDTPPGMDSAVFRSLPADLQRDLAAQGERDATEADKEESPEAPNDHAEEGTDNDHPERASSPSDEAAPQLDTPPGMDSGVFRDLPADIQQDLVTQADRNPSGASNDPAEEGANSDLPDRTSSGSSEAAPDLDTPPGMDSGVFRNLPADIQQDLVTQANRDVAIGNPGESTSSVAQANASTTSGRRAPPMFTVPSGVDPDVFHGLPHEIQHDVTQNSNRNRVNETPDLTLLSSLPHVRGGTEPSNSRENVMQALETALSISAAPLRPRIPSHRTRRRRQPRLLRTTMAQLANETEERLAQAQQLFDISRSRSSDD